MDDFVPALPNELNVRTVRITEAEGVIENLVVISANYSILANDRFVITDDVCTVTLPNVNKGKQITVKNISSSGVTTIDGGDYNIDGHATDQMANQYDWRTMVMGETEWHIIASS